MAGMRWLWQGMVAGGVPAPRGGGGGRGGGPGGGGGGPGGGDPPPPPPPPAAPAPTTRTGIPELQVELVASGLSHVWDIGFLPDGRALVTERDGRIALLSGIAPGATVREVDA